MNSAERWDAARNLVGDMQALVLDTKTLQECAQNEFKRHPFCISGDGNDRLDECAGAPGRTNAQKIDEDAAHRTFCQ